VAEEAGVPEENHRPWTSNWTLSLVATSRVHLFRNLQSRARTHAVLVIGLYVLLDPTTYLIEPPGSLQRPNSLSHPGPKMEMRF
jgi:hypothetical protein